MKEKVFDSVETYDNDPMLWMDPVAMTSMASDIRDYLVDKYPVYQKIFDENYDQLEMDLARLDADFQSIHDQHKNIAFVSMTPSFGNWTEVLWYRSISGHFYQNMVPCQPRIS